MTSRNNKVTEGTGDNKLKRPHEFAGWSNNSLHRQYHHYYLKQKQRNIQHCIEQPTSVSLLLQTSPSPGQDPSSTIATRKRKRSSPRLVKAYAGMMILVAIFVLVSICRAGLDAEGLNSGHSTKDHSTLDTVATTESGLNGESPRLRTLQKSDEGQLEDSNEQQDEEWKQKLLQRIARIRGVCGTLCTNSDNETTWMANSVDSNLIPRNTTVVSTSITPGDRNGIRLTIARDLLDRCPAILTNDDIDAAETNPRYVAPFPPPDELMPYYTMGGAGGFSLRQRIKQVYLGQDAKENIWTKEHVDGMVERIQQNRTISKRDITYGRESITFVKAKLEQMNLAERQHVLVIGSERPWVEAICLALGARQITTLEYGSIESRHPQITTMTPQEMKRQYISGDLPIFDAVVSHSSVEHSGLGRYGDSLNPWADLLAIARAWCVTTDDAILYLGVPSEKYQDFVSFNAHRLYSRMRWSLITTNWLQLEEEQPVLGDNGVSTTQRVLRTPNKYGKETGGDGALFRKVTNFDMYLPQATTSQNQ